MPNNTNHHVLNLTEPCLVNTKIKSLCYSFKRLSAKFGEPTLNSLRQLHQWAALQGAALRWLRGKLKSPRRLRQWAARQNSLATVCHRGGVLAARRLTRANTCLITHRPAIHSASGMTRRLHHQKPIVTNPFLGVRIGLPGYRRCQLL